MGRKILQQRNSSKVVEESSSSVRWQQIAGNQDWEVPQRSPLALSLMLPHTHTHLHTHTHSHTRTHAHTLSPLKPIVQRSERILRYLIPTRKVSVKSLSTVASSSTLCWMSIGDSEKMELCLSEREGGRGEKGRERERDLVRHLITIHCLGVNSWCQNQSRVRERRKNLGNIFISFFSPKVQSP